jgi:hypothetical protein
MTVLPIPPERLKASKEAMYPPSIWIGWDPREAAAYAVAWDSVKKHAMRQWQISGVVLSKLIEMGLYSRPMEMRPGVDRPVMWDVLSDAPMSTEHANARFLVPHLAKRGWALFMDGDMMIRDNLGPLFASLDPKYAVYCVKHNFKPDTTVKMDGQFQTVYPRKNWSSFIIFNCEHKANAVVTPEMVNVLPGRDLHRLCWLEDELIGELDPAWNYLVGHSVKTIEPKCIHWTDGVPDMKGHENAEYADLWRRARDEWAAGQLSMAG